MRLKNGDTLPRGTSIGLTFKGDSLVFLEAVYVGKSGRDYLENPTKLRVTSLHRYVRGIRKPPSIKQLEKMSYAGVVTTPTGHRVAPDGYGPDGSPSWFLALGLI